MARIYTKTGDQGMTALVSGHRVSKSHLRIECYGTVDELNSFIGHLRVSVLGNLEHHQVLKRIQNCLFNLGSQLACDDALLAEKLPQVSEKNIAELESAIDQMEKDLSPLKSFILPGGSESASRSHLCRTVARRAERLLVSLTKIEETSPLFLQYLNRLSDYFFVLARHLNHLQQKPDEIWEKE